MKLSPFFSNIWKVNGVSVKGKFASFSPGALHLLVMETTLKYKPLQNKRTKGEKIKEEDQKKPQL